MKNRTYLAILGNLYIAAGISALPGHVGAYGCILLGITYGWWAMKAADRELGDAFERLRGTGTGDKEDSEPA